MSDNDTTSQSPEQEQKPKGEHKSRLQAASDRVKELEARANKLRETLASVERAKIEKEKALEKLQHVAATPRATINKRKILIGAMIMKDMDDDPKVEKQIRDRLDKFLDRETDRKAFDLPPRPAAAAPTEQQS